MQNFKVIITEHLRKVITTEASNKEEARHKVEKQYNQGDIVLSADDFSTVFITPAYKLKKQNK